MNTTDIGIGFLEITDIGICGTYLKVRNSPTIFALVFTLAGPVVKLIDPVLLNVGC